LRGVVQTETPTHDNTSSGSGHPLDGSVTVEVVDAPSDVELQEVAASNGTPPSELVEEMDSSVCLKRSRRDFPADVSSGEAPSRSRSRSRSRSSGPRRKIGPAASPKPSSRGKGFHKGLPDVSPSRPSRV